MSKKMGIDAKGKTIYQGPKGASIHLHPPGIGNILRCQVKR
jgi:hypothetical protein